MKMTVTLPDAEQLAMYYQGHRGQCWKRTLEMKNEARTQPKKEKNSAAAKDRTSISRSVAFAVILYVADVFTGYGPGLALLVLVIGIPVSLIKVLKVRKDSVAVKKRLIVTGIYAIAIIADISTYKQSKMLVEKKIMTIVTACEQYKGKYGAYPETLEAMVPAFLQEIPKGQTLALRGKIIYASGEDSHIIAYVFVSQLYRRRYKLEDRRFIHSQ